MRPRVIFDPKQLVVGAHWEPVWLRMGIRIDHDGMPEEIQLAYRRLAIEQLAEAAADLSLLHEMVVVGPIFVREEDRPRRFDGVPERVVEYQRLVVPASSTPSFRLAHLWRLKEDPTYLHDWVVMTSVEYRELVGKS